MVILPVSHHGQRNGSRASIPSAGIALMSTLPPAKAENGTNWHCNRCVFAQCAARRNAMSANTQRSYSRYSNGNGNGASRGGGTIYRDVVGIVGSLMRSQQREGAERIAVMADAAREFGGNVAELRFAKPYVVMGADKLDQLADYVGSSTLEDMAHDVSRFGRRNPLVMFGLAVAAGFAVMRLQGITHRGSAHSSRRSRSARPGKTKRRRNA
jgi:hypothetical protein